MNLFKKYGSIENTYRQKIIDYYLERYPQLKDCRYIISEKIHGANISFIITKTDFFVAKRSSIVKEGESFYDIQNIVKKPMYQNIVQSIQNNIIKEEVEVVTLYGEFFGGKIQKGINYGTEKQILFFDILINGEYQSQNYFITAISTLGFSDFIVPTIAMVNSLEEAINYPIDFDSKVLGIKDNICEGVVIKPYFGVYLDGNGTPFYLKNKNEAFKEKQKKDKKKIDTENFSEEIKNLHLEFLSYITDNRLQSIFSHEGLIEDRSEVGKYIKLYLEDAKTDFIKDLSFKEEDYDKPALKYIFNVGSKAANMIMAHV